MVRNILVTGATGLVGIQLLKNLIKDGNNILITSRNIEKTKKLLNKHEIKNVSIIYVDLMSENATKSLIDSIKGTIDVVIHNARSVEYLKITEGSVSSADFQAELYMAVVFPYLLLEGLLKRNQPIKDIIFINSIYGVVAPNKNLYNDLNCESAINYGVSKAAQIHLSKELAVRYSDLGIRSNCISFGGIKGRASQDFMEKYNQLTPLRGMLSMDDLYPPIKFILDNMNLPITGENIKIDGGWTIW